MADNSAMLCRLFDDLLDLFCMTDEGHAHNVDIFIKLADGRLGDTFRSFSQRVGNHVHFWYFGQKDDLLWY